MLDLRLSSAMSYTFHRIFCGTPGDLEAERDAFYEVMAEFNEHEAMPKGILFVSLSIVPLVVNMTVFQGTIDENIRSCRHYVQVLADTWGPPQRSFKRSFDLARQCAADPAMPMREVALLCKEMPSDHPVESGVLEARKEAEQGRLRSLTFSDPGSFRQQLRGLLAAWLADAISG